MEPWKVRVYASYRESAGAAVDPRHLEALWALERRQYIQRYSTLLPADKTAPILDIGCGSGTFLDALRSIGYSNLEGIDISPTQVQAARARGLHAVSVGSATDYLRDRRERYAVIGAFSVLEHLTRAELFATLDAVHQALAPGGVLVAMVPNAKGLFGAHVRFADITHELSFTPTSVRQICAVTGFECPAVLEHGPLVHGPTSAARWLVWQAFRAVLLVARLAEGGDWRAPIFTQDLVFVARKPALPSARTI